MQNVLIFVLPSISVTLCLMWPIEFWCGTWLGLNYFIVKNMDTWQRIIGTRENHFLKVQHYPHSFRWPTLPPFVKSLLPPFVKTHPQRQPNRRPKSTSPDRLNLIIFFALAHTLLPANSFKLNLTNNNIKPNKKKTAIIHDRNKEIRWNHSSNIVGRFLAQYRTTHNA